MHIDEIWEAFIDNDMKLTLKIPTKEGVDYVKNALSNYKHRQYQRDPELKEVLGDWKLMYSAKHHKDENSEYWKLSISTTQATGTNVEVEILNEDDD